MTNPEPAMPSGPIGDLDISENLRSALSPPRTPGSIPVPPPEPDAPRVVAVGLESLTSGLSVQPTVRSEHRLSVVLDGTLMITVDDDEFRLSTGEALLAGAGASQCESVAGDRECQRMAVDFRWEGFSPGLPLVLRDAAGRLRELTQWLLVERKAEFDDADRYRSDVVRLLVGESRRLAIDSSGVLEKRIRAFVLEHIDEPISLEDLARHVGMGRFHLCRKYRKLTGHPPMQAVRAIRMEQARELIRTTNLPLRIIAEHVALKSEQHLSRLLKVHFGVGVRELRAASCSVTDSRSNRATRGGSGLTAG